MRIIAALAILFTTTAQAADTPESVGKYRHLVMESLAYHMRASSMIAKGEISHTDDIVYHAVALHEAAKTLSKLWPEGTGPDVLKESESKPEIWTKRAKFDKAIKDSVDATAKLVEVAKTGDLAAFGAQMGEVGPTCGDCHDAFRVDEED
jgi:cytochrome c556